MTQIDRYRTVFRLKHIGDRKSSEKIFHQDDRILLEDFIVGREAYSLGKNLMADIC